MSKILLVSYTPRYESNTQKLIEAFLQANPDGSEVVHLDLVKEPAPLLLEDNLNALLKRNFMGLKLTSEENSFVANADTLLQQVQHADRIVVAFPMYNFSVPAAVKAWIDVIIQNGKTFRMIEEGGYEGLCHGKQALMLMTTGGDYSQEPTKSMNYATPLMQTCFGFMGIEAHSIIAHGLNQYMDRVGEIIEDSKREVVNYIENNQSW
jgi:FMN-dependent NADH-azoreductase